jgi:hypothetical protein
MVQGFQEQESRRRERASEPGTTPPDPVRAKAAEKATANPRASEPAAAMNMSALGVVLRARRGRRGQHQQQCRAIDQPLQARLGLPASR